MSEDNGLRPRPGPAPRLIEGPSAGQRSLYQQQVLDEDEYTEALSRIIGRDFFPDLPHLQATNSYLDALSRNDPDALSASIRRLARIAQDKDEGRSSWTAAEREAEAQQELRQQFDSTPRINLGRLGNRSWDDTPAPRSSRRARSHSPDADAGPSRPPKRQIRDDLTLDAFQRNYTSEDNAAFSAIVHAENEANRRAHGWAWALERVQADKRIAGEEARAAILGAAQGGNWVVDGEGRRMLGGLASGSRERADGEGGAWEQRKLIAAPTEGSEGALVVREGAGALVKGDGGGERLAEKELPAAHPLTRALERAGLPPTALLDGEGQIVPARDLASGAGDGRGRGAAARRALSEADKRAMGADAQTGGGVPQWPYRSMNALMFPPDAYAAPYPPPAAAAAAAAARKGPAPEVAYRNTRIADEEDEPAKAPSTSYASTRVDRRIRGRPSTVAESEDGEEDEGEESGRGQWDLVEEEPDLEPEDLPLMTWGSLLSTPKRVDSGDVDEGPQFRFPEEKKRDTLGRRLGTAASKSISDRAKKYAPATPSRTPNSSLKAAAGRTVRGSLGSSRGSMPPPGSARGNLTPAARSLLERTTGRTPMRMRKEEGVFGGKVGNRGWSPSPRR